MDYKKILLAILAAVFISLFAQIEIELPLNEEGISISGQTFAILLPAFFLGRWYALLSVVIYIIMGASGLPVFSGGASGYENLYGGSAGYFGGFLYAAFHVGGLGENRAWRKSLFKCILAMLTGTLYILAFGVLRLSFKYGFLEAMEIGCYPFLLGGLVKVVLGGVVAYFIERLLSLRKMN